MSRFVGSTTATTAALKLDRVAADTRAMNPSNENEPPAAPPAGWYADPLGIADVRWWSGTGWTEHTHNMVAEPQSEPTTDVQGVLSAKETDGLAKGLQQVEPELGTEPEPEPKPQPKAAPGDWGIRKPFKVMGAIIVALIAVVVVAGVLGETEKPAANAPEPAAAASADSSGGVTILADKSFCLPDPSSAKIYLSVALRNDGASAEEIELTPVRRYSDNSTNDSVIDTVTATVEPGGAIQTFHADFGYNAEEHSLLECSLRDKDFLDTPIPVIE